MGVSVRVHTSVHEAMKAGRQTGGRVKNTKRVSVMIRFLTKCASNRAQPESPFPAATNKERMLAMLTIGPARAQSTPRLLNHTHPANCTQIRRTSFALAGCHARSAIAAAAAVLASLCSFLARTHDLGASLCSL